MTLGEKISVLRKENNYTQEQLADCLEVSRQTVSKWESNLAYPETEKLLKLGRLFHCSMDYLLKDECTDRNGKSDDSVAWKKICAVMKAQCRERKSQKRICGMPLYHIARNAKGFFAIGMNAKGVFALGLRAQGCISCGLLSFGLLSVGLLSIGFIALGTLALGPLAIGSIALGLFAVGAISIGIVSCGALAIGAFSNGALAIGKYAAIGDHARAMIALGGHEAIGGLYRHLPADGAIDIQMVKELLHANVPRFFAWARDLFILFL